MVPEPTITSFSDWALVNKPPTPIKRPLPKLKDRVTVRPAKYDSWLPTHDVWEPVKHSPPLVKKDTLVTQSFEVDPDLMKAHPSDRSRLPKKKDKPVSKSLDVDSDLDQADIDCHPGSHRTIYRRGADGGYSFKEEDATRSRRWHHDPDKWKRKFLLSEPEMTSQESVSHNGNLDEAAIRYQTSMIKLNGHIQNIDRQ